MGISTVHHEYDPSDEYWDGFHAWCAEHDEDPNDPDVRSEYDEELSLADDPYAYYGVSRGDFL